MFTPDKMEHMMDECGVGGAYDHIKIVPSHPPHQNYIIIGRADLLGGQ